MLSARFIFFVMASMLLFSLGCSNRPADLIDEETYIDLLVEFELIESLYQVREDSDESLRFKRKVFREYGITEEQFRRSHQWYEQDVPGQLSRYRTALDRLNEEYGKISAEQRRRQQEEDEKDAEDSP